MEIIIHGKPNAGSSKSTFPSDNLSQRIVDDFFTHRDEITEKEVLVAEARNWAGKWYSVYTYRLSGLTEAGSGVGRPTYFALSVVMPGTYCCLTSEVYEWLRQSIKTLMIGTYFSDKGKYIVNNFDDSKTFDRIVDSIKKNYVNLSEDFDSKFIAQAEFSNNNRYNLADCDSKAFVELLKSKGRILVSKNVPTKDEQVAKTNEYIQKYNNEKNINEAKDKQIGSLTKELELARIQLSEANMSSSKKVKNLEQEVLKLQEANSGLRKQREIDAKKINDVAQIIGVQKNAFSQTGIPGGNQVPPKPKPESKPSSALSEWVPLINTFLIVTGIIILVFFKGCSAGEPARDSERTETTEDQTDSDVQSQNEDLQQNGDQWQTFEPGTHESQEGGLLETAATEPSSVTAASEAKTKDKNGEIKLIQDGKEVRPENVDLNKPVTFKVNNPQAGYTFLATNLKDPTSLVAGTPIKLEEENSKESIIIIFKSNDGKNKKEFEFN